MENKKESRPVLKYTNEDEEQSLFGGDHIICRTKDGERYIGRIVTICRYRENKETEPEDVIYLNTSQNKMSYSGEIIKVADITYICKIPANHLFGYPHIDEKQDKSVFINMIVGLGYDEKIARDMHENIKELIALYNVPLSSILSIVIHEIGQDKGGWSQNELINIYNKLIGTMVKVFQDSNDSLRKRMEESISFQDKE